MRLRLPQWFYEQYAISRSSCCGARARSGSRSESPRLNHGAVALYYSWRTLLDLIPIDSIGDIEPRRAARSDLYDRRCHRIVLNSCTADPQGNARHPPKWLGALRSVHLPSASSRNLVEPRQTALRTRWNRSLDNCRAPAVMGPTKQHTERLWRKQD